MQAISISSMIQPLLTKAMTEADSKTERWMKIAPRVEKDMLDYGLDRVPKNLAEIISKIGTGESAEGKGLFLAGTTGTGKTKRLKFISEKIGIRMVSALEIVKVLTVDGEEYLRDLCKCDVSRYSSVPPHYYDLIIDDVGAEPAEQVVYGTRFNIIADVIEMRYQIFPQWKTHVSTNLTKDQFRERYGNRVYSRINEMCHFVTMAGIDRRINTGKHGGHNS